MKISKACSVCKEEKSLELFNRRTSATDGRNSNCKSCEKIYRQSEGYKARGRKRTANNTKVTRQTMFTFMKDKACILCGETHIAALQFDHRDPSIKKWNISDAVTRGYEWTVVQEEIDKCDILCANCHHKKTAIQFNWYKDCI